MENLVIHMQKTNMSMQSIEKSVEPENDLMKSSDIFMEEMMKQREEHINREINRMEHYKDHLENKIQSIKVEIDCQQYRPSAALITFMRPGIFNETTTKSMNAENNSEQLQNELAKNEMKLIEHLNELEKRKIQLEECRAMRIECESKLQLNRQDKEYNQLEKHQYYEKEFVQLRVERVENEIELLQRAMENMRNEIQHMKNKEKRNEREKQYVKIREQLLLKRQILQTLTQQVKKRISQVELCVKRIHSKFYPKILIESEEFLLENSCIVDTDSENSMIPDQTTYDIFISYSSDNTHISQGIKQILPQYYSIHGKDNLSSKNIKICLDKTSTVVIAIVNQAYELDKPFQVDITHIFKRQFPLVFVISEEHFTPTTNWLNLVWNSSKTQRVYLNGPDFKENLRNAFTDARWNLPTNLNILKSTESTTNERSHRFLGDDHEWIVAYSNPSQVSHNCRQFITDPLRIDTDIKLRDFYYNYICLYFENPDLLSLFEKGANENNMIKFVKGYTQSGLFSATLNHHLAANVLFYFESTLYDNVDYQLVKCLIDFVTLFLYRQELQPYLFNGIVYRGVIMLEKDLTKYVVGSRMMNTTFLSTSKDPKVAEFFSGKDQQEFAVICTYVIHNSHNRRTALDISSKFISCFPDEQEVLILPFSAFYVKSVIRPSDNSKTIKMTLVEDDSIILEHD